MKIQVAILEDETILRERYLDLINSAPDMAIAWAFPLLGLALEELNSSRASAPDVLLVDLGLPDGSGLSAIRCARDTHPACEIMVVSMFGDEENVVAAIEAGAAGYLLKDSLPETFLDTIRELKAGGSPISPRIARMLLERSRTRNATAKSTPAAAEIQLADRELEILSLVAKGFNFPEIARLLEISTNTVKTHIYRIYRKLAVHSRGQAVFEAKKMGLLDF